MNLSYLYCFSSSYCFPLLLSLSFPSLSPSPSLFPFHSSQLWPLFGGKVVKPHKSKLFYIPQRPYMTLGTLRDQVIYPDTAKDQEKHGISDEQLGEFLNKVGIN